MKMVVESLAADQQKKRCQARQLSSYCRMLPQ